MLITIPAKLRKLRGHAALRVLAKFLGELKKGEYDQDEFFSWKEEIANSAPWYRFQNARGRDLDRIQNAVFEDINSCGAVACAAGWSSVIFPEFYSTGQTSFYEISDLESDYLFGNIEDVAAAARKLKAPLFGRLPQNQKAVKRIEWVLDRDPADRAKDPVDLDLDW